MFITFCAKPPETVPSADIAGLSYTAPIMSKRVLILDNALHRRIFRPPRHWRVFLEEVPVDVVNVPSGQPIPDLRGYSHLILTGSETSITRPKAWFGAEVKAILGARDLGIPMLGSCFGHQMLVYALSGPQYLRTSPTPEIGWTVLEQITPDPLFAETPTPWYVFSFHFDEVFEPPPPWRVLARSALCPVHVLRYGGEPIWGIQAHPEISPRKAKLFLRLFLLVRRHAKKRILAVWSRSPDDDRAISSIVSKFLDVSRCPPKRSSGTAGR